MRQRTFKSVVTIAVAVFVALATTSAVLAFSSGPPIEVPIIPATDAGEQATDGTAASNCNTRYRNGDVGTINHLNWCFSDDGNISHLEHGDELEHAEVGTLYEGWCLSAAGTKRGQTAGGIPNEMLSAASYPSPDKVRHNTTDGDFRVESRFSTSPGNKQIVVKMNVRNNTDAPISDVFLTRFIDADIANTTEGDVWTSTLRSVSVSEPGIASLQLFPKTSEFMASSMIFADFFPDLDGDCYNAAADGTLSAGPSDRSMGVMYQLGTIFPGQTRTVQFLYRITN